MNVMIKNTTPTLSPIHPGQPAGQHVNGMNCPVCQMFIPISVSQLLYDGEIMCPYCGLTMTINKSQSNQALDALKKLEDATTKLRETESFKR